ncbi:hypothetical protein FSP39_017799 [Pinctada imbricata]|uniref:Tetraspanin n=1 Tax=Pinctada imbricata TaxID=66713 RepID=A0AA89BXH0_PINIB|nr:hypothetical protein FSP39_017799 [Pinctada imbricata]
MCLTIRISESGRQKLGLTVAVLNGLLSLTGLALIGIGAYMNIHLESKMALMEGYDSGTLPYFLITLGLLMFVLDGLFAKAGYDCAYPESRSRFQNLLILFILMKFVLIWVILAGSIMSFTHQAVIRESFRNGLTAIMKRYKTDKSAKMMMDQVQISYKCCGSNTYLDWLTTNWINEEFLDTKSSAIKRKMRNGLYYSDDVPFSCCDPEVQRPCVHHDIRNKAAHINYGAITLHKQGCAAKLMFFIEYAVLSPTAYTVLIAFFVQMITCILLRYLQTSIMNACLMKPLGPGAGYVIPECPCDLCKTGDPMKYTKEGRYEEDADTGAGGGGGGGGDFSNFGGGGGGGGGGNREDGSDGGGDGFDGVGKGKDKGEKQKGEKDSKKREKEGKNKTKDGDSKKNKNKDKATKSPDKSKKSASPPKQKPKAKSKSPPKTKAKAKPRSPKSPKKKALKSPKKTKAPKASPRRRSPRRR